MSQLNNSGAQGELFYLNFTSASQFTTLQVNGVYTCPTTPENVEAGTVTVDGKTTSGFTAISNDMILGSTNSLSCFASRRN